MKEKPSHNKVYLVKYWNPCYCEDSYCECNSNPSISGIFFSKENAEKESENIYKSYVEEVIISDSYQSKKKD
jgi:hypothetical protein